MTAIAVMVRIDDTDSNGGTIYYREITVDGLQNWREVGTMLNATLGVIAEEKTVQRIQDAVSDYFSQKAEKEKAQ